MIRRIFVWPDRDGFLVTPREGRRDGGKKRVYVGGLRLQDLSRPQLEALVDLVFREPGAYRDGAVFQDGPRVEMGGDRPSRDLIPRIVSLVPP